MRLPTNPVETSSLGHDDGAALAQVIREAATDAGQSWSKAKNDDVACILLAGFFMGALMKYGYELSYNYDRKLDPRDPQGWNQASPEPVKDSDT